jgi:hypothetical protein
MLNVIYQSEPRIGAKEHNIPVCHKSVNFVISVMGYHLSPLIFELTCQGKNNEHLLPEIHHI